MSKEGGYDYNTELRLIKEYNYYKEIQDRVEVSL